MDEIRAVLYPEIRVGWANDDAELLEVMDREQESLAKSLGDGHRLVRGVAGSGKTIVLMCRARHLRQLHPDWRILVLCFNRVLADHLSRTIGADDRLQILTFHAWCSRELRGAKVSMPPAPERGQAWHEYWERVPTLLLDAYATGQARAGAYQAILVGEGQDFANDWYRAILKALDPASNSLFIALDSSQNIYNRRVSWRELGVQVAASFLLAEQSPGTVRLSPIHSAKGLDAGHVLLFGGHDLEERGDEDARRLLYIGMTRAREELCVSYHAKSRLMEELLAAVSEREH